MEHGGGADASAEMPGIGGDREQGFGCRAEQQVVDHRLVLVGDWSDLGRQREDHVKIADWLQIGLAGRKPIPRRRTLTLWAMAVAARNGHRPLRALWGVNRNGESAAGCAVGPVRFNWFSFASGPFHSP